MSENLTADRLPDLVFGLAGPLGVNLEIVSDSLRQALAAVNYKAFPLKLTKENSYYESAAKKKGDDYFSVMKYKMDHATTLCSDRNDPAFHARLAVMAIRERRSALENGVLGSGPAAGYIIHQLKRPAEVALLRSVYGEQFILISVHASLEERKHQIHSSLKRTLPPRAPESEIQQKLNALIEIDEDEGIGASGQQLREVFQLGDVFISAEFRQLLDSNMKRFVDALFGNCAASPNKDEFGMYAAKGASLRSCDLSRQVGAAILSQDGDLLSQGCNEVPKALGGTYWDGDTTDYRDISVGFDPNQRETREVLRDLFQTLLVSGYLSEDAKKMGGPSEIVDQLIRKKEAPNDVDGALSASSIRDITEYGRSVHAEMSAICDAARTGRSLQGATLFCTTFPCHNCTKHILSAGIRRVVFIEPYPKSRAQALFDNEIDFAGRADDKVRFEPFLGISPAIYRTIFQKGRRKDASGQAKKWVLGEPRPMIRVIFPAYLFLEAEALRPIVESPKSSNAPTTKKRARAKHKTIPSKKTSPTRRSRRR